MIRRIKSDTELHTLFGIIAEDAAAVGISWADVDEKKLWVSLYMSLEHAAIWVAEKDGEIIGIMWLTVVESFWGTTLTLHNLIYFVAKRHRSSHAGYLLLKAAKEYARERQMDLEIKVHSFEDNERKDTFFSRHGFKKLGHNYIYEV